MKTERYVPFIDGNIGLKPVFLATISYSEGILDIVLSCEGTDQDIHVTFDQPLVFRISDEGDRLKSLSHSEGMKEFTILSAKNSQLKSWVNSESDGAQDCAEVEHYAVLTENERIDVLAWEEPKIINPVT